MRRLRAIWWVLTKHDFCLFACDKSFGPQYHSGTYNTLSPGCFTNMAFAEYMGEQIEMLKEIIKYDERECD